MRRSHGRLGQGRAPGPTPAEALADTGDAGRSARGMFVR